MWAKTVQPLKYGVILRLYMRLLATPPLSTIYAPYLNALPKKAMTFSSISTP